VLIKAGSAPTTFTEVVTDEQQIARRAQALKDKLRGRGGKRGRGTARLDSASGRDSYPNSECVLRLPSSSRPLIRCRSESTKKTAKKALRKWGHEAPTESDMAELDFSYDKLSDLETSSTPVNIQALIDEASLGSRTRDGLYEVKDWEFGRAAVAEANKQQKEQASSSLGTFGSIFARLTGSKMLTEEDLKPVLESMKQHLMKKNVAKDIADKVCEGIGESLVGKKVGGFQCASSLFALCCAADKSF
jgi:signal recognition particle receptor subunit alpha